MEPPIRIPGIETEGELGRGAYSVVFRGRHGVTPCAVKLPRWRGRSHRWFRREAVALARITDPGLPAVMDVGEVEGIPYLVMELADGEPLSERLRRGRLSEDETLDLAAQLCGTLSAVHRRGLVHRDIKPSNVVIEPESGRVRLVDFGFVAQMERADPEEAAGTAAYAPPEQLDVPQTLDARSDLHALGVVLFECLAGDRPPHRTAGGSIDVDAASSQLEQLHVRSGLVSIVLGLVAPDPGERYSSTAPVLRDVERVQMGLEPLGPELEVPSHTARMPLIGRAAELEAVGRRWREASQGRGSVLLLQGVPGVGKSRLLGAVVDRIRATNLLFASCEEGDPTPLAALGRMFDGYLDRLAMASPEERSRAEKALRRAAGDRVAQIVALVSPRLGEVLGYPEVTAPSREIHEAFVESMAEFLHRFAREAGPMMVCVDDLQWVDPVSLNVLVRVAHRVADVPLFFVTAARIDEQPFPNVRRFRDSLGEERLDTLEVSALDDAAISGLLAAYLGVESVDPELVHRVATLSDGTPLSVVEILEAFLDHGALVPHWGAWHFDADAAERMLLPGSVSAILRRRLEDLRPAARRVIEAAAVMGPSFDDEVLGEVTGVGPEDLGYATGEIQRAGLVQQAGRNRLRFVHDRVRETLLAGLPQAEHRRLHGVIARALDRRMTGATEDAIYEVARHYALASPESDSVRTCETCRAAAERAAARFDDETAMRFFDWAHAAAGRGGVELDPAFYRHLGETCLRVGALQESLAAFDEALEPLRDPVDRAEVLGRIAWVHQTRADPERAWEVLREAFEALGSTLPREGARSVSESVAQWTRGQVRSRLAGRVVTAPAERRRLQLLCELHYQNARLGVEYGRPLRFLQSTLRVLDAAVQLGPSRALAKSYAMYGFALNALGRSQAGYQYMDRGQAMAERLGDPVLFAYCRQLQSTARYWSGEIELANQMTRRILHELAHWYEASEFCMLSNSPRSVESMRGRPLHEWFWVEGAVERIRRSGRAPAAFLVIERGLRATLTALGREDEIPVFEERLRFVQRSPGVEEGFHGLLSWGARIRVLTEGGHLGEPFEREVAAFEAEEHDPRKAHIGLVEYYVHVANARLHQVLRADPATFRHRMGQLEAALRDLRQAARVPILKAHLQALEGHRAWLTGEPDKARKHFARAEKLADEESCPWVLYTVARGEAHMLRDAGLHEAARERARVAAMLAREHGAAHRLRWIGEEFDLRASSPPPPRSTRSISSSHRSRRRQLQTLLQVVRTSSQDLHLEQQARAVLDELVETLGADRGTLVYESEPGSSLRLVSGSDRRGGPAGDPVVQRVRETGEAWIGGPLPAAPSSPAEDESGHVLAAPLVLKERIVGAVSLERDRLEDPFTPEDRDLLSALAYQVLSALELTRLLEQRERLEESLRQAQKMEAVGRLAGGIAHDFNNMLTVIENSVETLTDRPDLGREAGSDLEMIQDAAHRAKSLTRQLLAFSRRQVVHPEVHDPNAVLAELAPMLQRLIGEHIKVVLDLQEEVHPVKVDRSFFEQAVVNLAANARDAMPKGGRLILSTRNVDLDASFVRDRGGLGVGPHVHLMVADTGEGMADDVKARIFDPFFTTKQLSGTGLGLSTVYGFAQQSSGHIEVESEVGEGTTFHLYLPKTREALRGSSKHPPAERAGGGSETVLLVEDERLVRNSVRRILQRAGYHVLSAEGGEEALGLVNRHAAAIKLVVTDVLMPDMSGPELIARLRDRMPEAKVLYMSGYTDGHLVAHGVLEKGVSLLHKPFTSADLRQRLRGLLGEDGAGGDEPPHGDA